MNRNIKITIGLSLASVLVAAILLVCKKQKCACCKDSDPVKEKCCETKEQALQE